MTSARVFTLSRADLSGPDMARWYAAHEAKIVTAALSAGTRQALIYPATGAVDDLLARILRCVNPAGAT
jgi:hypothetical protein